MTDKMGPLRKTQYSLIFLFPEIYKPLKVNFAKEFERLSETSTGHIFTLCSEPHRELAIGNFRLYSGQIRSSRIRKIFSRLWIQIWFPLWLLWRRPPIDAIITWDPYASGLAGMILKFLFGTKLIVEVVGGYHKLDPCDELVGGIDGLKKSGNVVKKWLMRLVFHACVWSSDAIKVVNTDLEEFFNGQYPKKRLYRFPCFVATDYFRSLESYRGDYLLSVGFPFYRKGMDILIRAFMLIADKHPNMKLKIMGYAPESELQSYKQLAQASSRVEFIKSGWIEDVGEQLRGCYALVHAAREDAAPRVLFEAMGCRKPIVASRVSGAVDYILDGHSGLLCEIEDVEGLAHKLDWLLSNPEQARQMGEAGFERIEKEFSEEKYMSNLLTMIDEVVNSQERCRSKVEQITWENK